MKAIFISTKLRKLNIVVMSITLICASALTGYAENYDEISNAEKTELYAQYVEIAKAVSEESLCPVFVVPMAEFRNEDWVSPEQYRIEMEKIVKSLEISVNAKKDANMIDEYSSASATKTATATYTGGSLNIAITGSFNTQYSQSLDRQIFSGINYINAVKKSGNGTWTYKGYERSLIDGGRTYSVSVAGNIQIGTNVYSTVAHVKFYCSATGGIS